MRGISLGAAVLVSALAGWAQDSITVVWPPERVPRSLVVNGQRLSWRKAERIGFQGEVHFGKGAPMAALSGEVELEGTEHGWRIRWTLPRETWVAAATEGELGRAAPAEAKRALAAVLRCWIQGAGRSRHEDGSLCPLTHCAVVRGNPSRASLRAAASAPRLSLDPDQAFFTGSKGGVSLSPRQVWGRGHSRAGSAEPIPGDRWASWTRVLKPFQVEVLKGSVRPGLRPGQLGLRLGPSGPYPVEDLRLQAGRSWGWGTWPSNACSAEPLSGGGLLLRGHGWGHNVGLCLATALHRARQGATAEAILQDAFGEGRMGESGTEKAVEGLPPGG